MDSDIRLRPVPTHPGYAATADGTIVNTFTGKSLKNRIHKRSGYYDVQPQKNGKQRRVRVHAMVLAAFDGPRPDNLQCRHLDGDKSNNAIANLRWGSARENYMDQVRHGTARGPAMTGCFGQRHPASKLNEEQVTAILAAVDSGEAQHVVAARFGVSQMLVSRIHRGLNWPHLKRSLVLPEQ